MIRSASRWSLPLIASVSFAGVCVGLAGGHAPVAATETSADETSADGDGAASETDGASAAAVDFRRDVRPILSNHCFKCHGPDEATREAGLRLDTEEGATEDLGGYQAIVPGDSGASELVARLLSDDEDLRMPPPDSGLELSADQIATLRRWIDTGAAYQPHWAFVPPGRPESVSIDASIDRQLTAIGLRRSPPADRPTLLRRLHIDLLGVAPPPRLLDDFLADESPDAYRRLVDRLLADPQFGEKWGRHWLDQARYADSHGYTIDSPRTMWPYRDWVIDAINRDLSFDRFTIEQLAGDLLPDAGLSQQVATGFHRNTLINQEGGTDAEQFRNEATADRVNTTGAVWLGLTVACAQCHTHKFDPITHREYFQLFAFFNRAADTNGVAPTVRVASPQQQLELQEWDRRVAAADREWKEYDAAGADRAPESGARDGKPGSPISVDTPPWSEAFDWVTPAGATATAESGAVLRRLDDGSWLAEGTHADQDHYEIEFPLPAPLADGGTVSGLRIETLTHPSLPRQGPGRAANGNFVLHEVAMTLRTESHSRPARWLHAVADHSQPNYDVTAAIDGDSETGWAINGAERLNVDRVAAFIAEPLEVAAGEAATVRVSLRFAGKPAGYAIGRFRLALTAAPPESLGLPDPRRERLVAERKRARAGRERLLKSLPQTMVMRDRDEPRTTFVHIRGDFLRHGDEVRPGTPAVLPPLRPRGEEGPADRLDLARWLVDPEHPLTSRVTVNRIWMRLFGRGLVETENDFGLQGNLPTHPELLDLLAWRLVDDGWSVKRLIRRIVLSETYRQSSLASADSWRLDPRNLYLSRQSRLRVDAELVRDLTLSASGLLDRRVGGPGVYPPQPDGVYAFTQRQAAWPESRGGDRYRRGMYTFFMRSAPHPMLTTFDTPDFNTTCTRRTRSNTPLQSLTLANDVAMIEAARAMAKRLLLDVAADPANPADRANATAPSLAVEPTGPSAASVRDRAIVEKAFRWALSRSPSETEAETAVAYLAAQRSAFADAPDDAAALIGRPVSASTAGAPVADEAAVTMLSRLLINLDEFITRE